VLPTIVPGLTSVYVTSVAAGERHSLLLSKDGNLYSFGDGSMGQLGHGAGVLQCVAVCCSVLQRVAACRGVIQRGILYCSQKTAISTRLATEVWGNWGTELVCCSGLQHVAACCSVLRCDAACYSLLLSKDGNLSSFCDGGVGQLGHGTGGNSQYSALQSFHIAHLVTIRVLRISSHTDLAELATQK